MAPVTQWRAASFVIFYYWNGKKRLAFLLSILEYITLVLYRLDYLGYQI